MFVKVEAFVYFLIQFFMEGSHPQNGSGAELGQPCNCGSGKKAGSCCMAKQSCSCGSGKEAGECCFRNQ